MYKKAYNILIIIVLLFTLYGCKGDEDIKEHVISNDNISSYILVQANTYKIYNFEDKLEETTRFNIILNVDNKQTQEKNISYDVKVKNILGEKIKFISNNPSTLPAKITLLNNTNVGGNDLDEFIFTVKDEKPNNFYEKVMRFNNKDLYDTGYLDELGSDIVLVNFEVVEDNGKYNIKVIIDTTKQVHIDLQSFLVSDRRYIYSFFGLYGYNSNESSYYIENNYIYKEINMKFLYLRLEYYDLAGNKVELKAKYSLEDLL